MPGQWLYLIELSIQISFLFMFLCKSLHVTPPRFSWNNHLLFLLVHFLTTAHQRKIQIIFCPNLWWINIIPLEVIRVYLLLLRLACVSLNCQQNELHLLIAKYRIFCTSLRGDVLDFQNFLLLINGKLEILKEIATAKKELPKFYRTWAIVQ